MTQTTLNYEIITNHFLRYVALTRLCWPFLTLLQGFYSSSDLRTPDGVPLIFQP